MSLKYSQDLSHNDRYGIITAIIWKPDHANAGVCILSDLGRSPVEGRRRSMDTGFWADSATVFWYRPKIKSTDVIIKCHDRISKKHQRTPDCIQLIAWKERCIMIWTLLKGKPLHPNLCIPKRTRTHTALITSKLWRELLKLYWLKQNLQEILRSPLSYDAASETGSDGTLCEVNSNTFSSMNSRSFVGSASIFAARQSTIDLSSSITVIHQYVTEGIRDFLGAMMSDAKHEMRGM